MILIHDKIMKYAFDILYIWLLTLKNIKIYFLDYIIIFNIYLNQNINRSDTHFPLISSFLIINKQIVRFNKFKFLNKILNENILLGISIDKQKIYEKLKFFSNITYF